MEAYRLFTKHPIKAIENLLLHYAIPLGMEEFLNNIGEQKEINKQVFLHILPFLASNGLLILRRTGEQNKKLYELFHGCILAAFLNAFELGLAHDVYFPEDDSYDFLLMKSPRDKKPDFQLENKEIHKKSHVLKIEFTEETGNIKSAILNKLNKDYRGRILLISIFSNRQLNFKNLFDEVSGIKQDIFQTIWLMGQIEVCKETKKLAYFIAELIKHKKVFLPFELLVDWSKIKEEVNKALTQ
jgi:hypothetical protein